MLQRAETALVVPENACHLHSRQLRKNQTQPWNETWKALLWLPEQSLVTPQNWFGGVAVASIVVAAVAAAALRVEGKLVVAVAAVVVVRIRQLFSALRGVSALGEVELMERLVGTIYSVEKFQGSDRRFIIGTVGVSSMDQLAAEANPEARSALLRQAQEMIARDDVNAYLFQLAKTGVADARIEGLWENAPTQANDLTAVRWTE